MNTSKKISTSWGYPFNDIAAPYLQISPVSRGGAGTPSFHPVGHTGAGRVSIQEWLTHGQRNYKDTKPYMSSSLVFNRVFRLELQSVVLVCSTPLVNCCPSTFSLTSPTPPPPSQSKSTVNEDSVSVRGCGGGGWLGVLCCVIDHILLEFNTLFLTRFRTYKIATPPQTKMISKDDI